MDYKGMKVRSEFELDFIIPCIAVCLHLAEEDCFLRHIKEIRDNIFWCNQSTLERSIEIIKTQIHGMLIEPDKHQMCFDLIEELKKEGE